jgi:thiol-disulfide isomerase/thioredoxin
MRIMESFDQRVSSASSLCRVMVVAACLLSCAAASAGQPGDVREVGASEVVEAVRQCRGTVVMFHLYASWCAPCVREFPDINRIGFQYGANGFVLLAFSVDQNPAQLAQFLGDNQLSFVPARILPWKTGELALAIRTIGGTYRDGIPYTAVFNRSGRLVQEWTGANDFETYRRVIEPLLAAEESKSSERGTSTSINAPFGVNFEVAENQLFKFAQKRGNFCILTRDGKSSQTASADPYFLTGSSHQQSSIPDRKKFAEERLRSTGGVSGISIAETNELHIDNISGYEFIALAKDTDLNRPVVIYHVMLFADNRYYIMQGFTPPEQRDRNIRAFREISRSFRRK